MDIVLCSPPISLADSPLIGVSLLTAILLKNGYSCKLIDLNIELFRSGIYDDISKWDSIMSNYNFDELFDSEYSKIKKFIESKVEGIINLKPRFIGIGVFTHSNARVTRKMCEIIRQQDPTIKIVVGGIYTNVIGEQFLRDGIIDYYIVGAGEIALLELMKGNKLYPGINNSNNISVPFDTYEYPDYSQLDLSKYRSKSLYVTASRGCPYRCSFCNVPNIWKDYQLRNSISVADEMFHNFQNYGVTHFQFTDSLMNGDMENFRQMCKDMKELNVKCNNQLSMEWFLSIRNEKIMKPQDFDLMQNIGLATVKLGVESGSQQVLKHMKKGYRPPDLFYFMEQLTRVNIKCDLLFFTGYPTETEEDFAQSKQLLLDLVKYKSIIHYVRVVPLNIEKNTPIFEQGYNEGSTEIGTRRYEEFRSLILELSFGIRQDVLMSGLIRKKLIFNT